MMIVAGVGGAGVLVWPSWWSVLICAVAMQLQILFDCSDGEVARVRHTTPPGGVYLDRIGHYVTEALLPICIAIHVDGGLTDIDGWTTLGALTAVVVVMNKAFGDLIHVARGYSHLPLMSESADLAAPRGGLLSKLRRAVKSFPFYRAFVAIEFSLICLLTAAIDLTVGDHHVLKAWTIVMLPLVLVLSAGHLATILLSRRLTD